MTTFHKNHSKRPSSFSSWPSSLSSPSYLEREMEMDETDAKLSLKLRFHCQNRQNIRKTKFVWIYIYRRRRRMTTNFICINKDIESAKMIYIMEMMTMIVWANKGKHKSTLSILSPALNSNLHSRAYFSPQKEISQNIELHQNAESTRSSYREY